jgi:hypothetical protein
MAIEQALSGEAFERAAGLIETISDSFVPQTGRYHTLQRWVATLPENILAAHPLLSMQLGLNLREMGGAWREVAWGHLNTALRDAAQHPDSEVRARVRQAIVDGEIGEPHLLHIISRDPAPPPIAYVKVSGGIFVDMAIHDFDMARFLTGSEVNEVYVQADVRVDPAIGEAGDVDTAVTMLRFKNGVIGTIDNSRKAVYGYDQRVEVFGSGGAINSNNNYPNSVVLSNASAVQRDLPLNFFMQRYTESYANEIAQFVDAIKNKTAVPVNGHDGKMAFVIALAAKQSWLEKRPVKVAG